MLVVVKLGGAAITHKSELMVLREDVLAGVCRDVLLPLFNDGLRLVVVHGAGSFGHHHAYASRIAGGFDVARGPSALQVAGMCATHAAVAQLNTHVVAAACAVGLPAVGLSLLPSIDADDPDAAGAAAGDEHAAHAAFAGRVERLCALGIVPVIHGDVVLGPRGCAVFGGDRVVELLARHLAPERVCFLSDVAGLFTADPASRPGAELVRRVTAASLARAETASAEHDVSGGIRAKAEAALRIAAATGRPVFIASALVPATALAVCRHGGEAAAAGHAFTSVGAACADEEAAAAAVSGR